ncbi:LysR substrate-binding domain-containing protein [Conyzicola nivalis]|uniref:LysR family transcriptional regulator n=1 Tax=Conyzicola nivalis TaxID=1477021 RepID=A0A916SDJ6_9MICO|nr:LysR family transcriptional regulator [Conyzicola nivalis]GGA94869.1 LysR family transcriptional regulator [Conyzicola nivalis]
MDVDLRKLRYFVAVAEHGGFRRAAEVLRIGQPALTRQIKAFEGEMDAELFTRSFRGANLTEAGRRLLAEAPALLDAADSLRRQLALVRRMTEKVTMGFAQGIPIAPIVRDFTATHRLVEVDLLSISADEQAQATVTGRVDVCFARLPFVAHGLEIVPLYEEARVVALPSTNPIAHLEYVSLRDLHRFRLLQPPDGVQELDDPRGAYREYARGDVSGRKYTTASMDEVLEHVAAEHGIVVIPRSAAAMHPRDDITYREVVGVLPSSVVLAYSPLNISPYLEDLVELSLRHCGNLKAG